METPKPQAVLFDRKMKRNLFLLVCCQAIGQSANTMMFIATALSASVFYYGHERLDLGHRSLGVVPQVSEVQVAGTRIRG